MTYSIVFKKSADRSLETIPERDRIRILKKIQTLSENPRPEGSIKLKSVEGYHRIRIGVYRVIYSIQDDRLVVIVIRIAHRRDVYR